MSPKPDATLLETVLDGIGEAFYAVDSTWRITLFNGGAEAHFGVSRTEAVGRTLWELAPGSDGTELGHRFREAMARQEAEIITRDSVVVPGRRIEGRLFPLAGGLGVAFRDVTEQWATEQGLRQREAELARVQRIAGVGGLEVDLRDGFQNRRSPEYLRLHGLPSTATHESHDAWVSRIHPDDRERAEAEFRRAVSGQAVGYAAEYRIIRPNDGQERWIAASAEIERDADGRPIRLVGAHRDVTERRSAEERRKLLVHELNHRVKNTLATIQSIASQSFRALARDSGAWVAFEGRVSALSRAHDLLTRESWESADLRDVVAQAIAPFGEAGSDRLRAWGPSVRIPPQTSLALAMALQELATNALKYGALSGEGGYVCIAWDRLDGGDGRLELRWQERDGPPVKTPLHRGFGTRMIERSLASDLDGQVSLAFDPSGVFCVLHMSVAA